MFGQGEGNGQHTSLLCPGSIGGIQLSRAGGQLDNSRGLVDRSALGVRFQLMLWRL